MSIREQIRKHLSRFATAPYLFVGSGMSRRYAGLPDWEGLLRQLATMTERDFNYYRASGDGSWPRTASAIAESLHSRWWDAREFAEHREKYGHEARSREFALKVEAAELTSRTASSVNLSEELQEELDLLKLATIDGVITTNWDLLMEEVFPSFRVFIGQEELLFSAPQGVGEIYKIHGCCTQPSSLVVTEADYAKFEERNAYLAAKLMTVFVEHPVVVLGYSMSDPNVVAILRTVAQCLTSDNIGQLRDRLIFINWSPGLREPVVQPGTVVTDGYTIPVLQVRVSSFIEVFEALAAMPRKFPARLLRQLREHVYELVRTNDPHGRLYVQDLDEKSDMSDVDVVFGVGMRAVSMTGYKAVSRQDLIIDVVRGGTSYDARSIVKESLPVLLRNTPYVPVFKYLRESGVYNDAGLVDDGIHSRVIRATQATIDSFGPPKYYKAKLEEIRASHKTFQSLVDTYDSDDVVLYAALLPVEALKAEEVHRFLAKNTDLLTCGNGLTQTQFIKLVCLYDWLVYGTARTEK